MKVVSQFRNRAPVRQLLEWTGLRPSSFYYRNRGGKRGRKPSTHTRMRDGSIAANETVVRDIVDEVLNGEFVRYGYEKTTAELRDMGYLINRKKVYRLMRDSGLLLRRIEIDRSGRQFVKWRRINAKRPLEHICMDIKYIYLHGEKRHAYLLVIMDVCTRSVLAWMLNRRMRHQEVILTLVAALGDHHPEGITLRTDNGSQFLAAGLRSYIQGREICHEFTHVATPQENAYVESLFSIVQDEVVNGYVFDSLYHARAVFDRYFNQWYNPRRRHGSLGMKSPYQYWTTRFPECPIRRPTALSEGFVKGTEGLNGSESGTRLALDKSGARANFALSGQDGKFLKKPKSDLNLS